MRRAKEKSENGMITVEAVLSMLPFILVIMGIISLINIFMIHNKIQYAIYQVGNELSAYTYVYQAMGIREADLKNKGIADKETEELDKTIADTTAFLDQLSSLKSSAGDLKSDVTEWKFSELETDIKDLKDEAGKSYEAGKTALESGKILISDPMDLMRNLVFYGIENIEKAAKSALLAGIADSMIDKYLVKSAGGYTMSADNYLMAAGVMYNEKTGKLLDFSKSELFSDAEFRMIDIVVEYDVSVFFLELFFENPRVHIVQRCAVPAWLDGDGVTYKPESAEEK